MPTIYNTHIDGTNVMFALIHIQCRLEEGGGVSWSQSDLGSLCVLWTTLLLD